MNATTMTQTEHKPATPWWKEPYVWLVIGGPAIVVVAGIYTAVIAARGADPVLDRNAAQPPRVAASADKGQSGADAASQASMQPAHQARNHAASPVLPKSAAADK